MAAQQNFEGLSPLCLFLPNLVSAELGLRGGHSAQITGTCVLAWQGGRFSLPPPSSFLLPPGFQRRSQPIQTPPPFLLPGLKHF